MTAAPMNFVVWRRGLRGPVASLDLFDPRQSMDWKLNEQTTIAIFPLLPHQRLLSLDAAVAAYPCPQEVAA
jgi:hypothetical protein